MTPTQKQIDSIDMLCRSFLKKGFAVYFGIAPQQYGSYPFVRIKKNKKEWNFCDPNWDVVRKQLEMLVKRTIDLIN